MAWVGAMKTGALRIRIFFRTQRDEQVPNHDSGTGTTVHDFHERIVGSDQWTLLRYMPNSAGTHQVGHRLHAARCGHVHRNPHRRSPEPLPRAKR